MTSRSRLGLRRPAAAGAVACVIGLLAAPAEARVFFRWKSGAAGDRVLATLGGTTAYRAPISINGGTGRLTLFSFDRPMREVFRDLRRAFTLTSENYHGGTLGLATARDGKHVLRMVVFRMRPEQRTLVFKIEQTEEEFKTSRRPPARLPDPVVPHYPSARPRFTASDEEAAMRIAILDATGANPDAVRQHYVAGLDSGGWRPALPRRPAPGSTALLVHLKGQEIYCTLVEPLANRGGSRITVLHKHRRVR